MTNVIELLNRLYGVVGCLASDIENHTEHSALQPHSECQICLDLQSASTIQDEYDAFVAEQRVEVEKI